MTHDIGGAPRAWPVSSLTPNITAFRQFQVAPPENRSRRLVSEHGLCERWYHYVHCHAITFMQEGPQWIAALIKSWKHSVVPACFLLFAFLCHVLTIVRRSKLLRRFWNPFNNFVTFEDIPVPPQPSDRNNASKSRFLICLAIVSSVYWTVNMVNAVLVGQSLKVAVGCTLSILAWVRPIQLQ